jgi:hypothetical protein
MSVRSRSRLTVARDTARRFIAAIVAIAAFSSCNEHSPIQPATRTAPPGLGAVNANGVPFRVEFVFVAHQDDWQLFFGDRVADAANTAAKLVIVYTTAGDGGNGATFPAYWQAREQATNAAVDTITPAGPWACANSTVNTHVIYRCTKANTVNYYMHLPNLGDNSARGLSALRDRLITTLTAVDGTATYNLWGDVVSTLRSIITTEAGTEPDANIAIHTSETDREVNEYDHADHQATGDATLAAVTGHDYNRFWYIGYQNQYYPKNLTPTQLAVKWGTVIAYDKVMKRLMGETLLNGGSDADVWVPRTIYRSELSSGTPPPPPGPPSAPSGLVATAVTGSRVDLAWADNSTNEQGFNVERAPDVDGVAGTYAVIATVGANLHTYSDASLLSNVRYWYRVVAYNSSGSSSYSNESSSILVAPAAPSGLVGTAISMTRIDLSWTDNSADEQGFRVERAPDVGGVAGTYAQIASVGVNVRTYSNNTGLTAGTRYWYRVIAYNGAGTSAYSPEASATTSAAPTPPNAPSALVATPISGSRIDLAWTDNSADEQGFRVERAPDVAGVAGAYAQIASVGVNVRTYSNTGLTVGTQYWYRVIAYNTAGTSAYSTEASAMTSAAPTPPSAPSALVATPISGVRIDLAWTDNSADEQGFRVERAPDVEGVAGTYAQIASVGVNVRTYSNTGLTAGARYWYRVIAYNTAGTSAYSAEASATTILPPVPPTALIATTASGTRINLAWTDNSADEQGFRVERAPDVAGVPGTFAQIASVGVNVTTYGNTGLVNGTRYWYRVRAYNAGGTSVESNVADATTLRLPNAPSNMQAAAVSPSTVDISWTDNSDNETSYRLDRALDNAGVPGGFASVATLGADVTTYRNTGLKSGTSYWFRVRAQNSVGNSAFAPAVNVTTMPAIPPSNLAVRAYLIGTQRNAELTWTPGSEARIDVWRAGVKVTSSVVNNGGPRNYTSGTALGLSVPYQVCLVGMIDAASCTLVVYANY